MEGKFSAVHIGTDSHDSKRKYTFANVICFTKKNKSSIIKANFDKNLKKVKNINMKEKLTNLIRAYNEKK